MGERMAGVDAAWLRMDRAENTADVVALLTFRQLPPLARLRQLIEERLLICPRFRQRAVRRDGAGHDAWEEETAFALDEHLVRHRLKSSAPEALRELVSEVCTEPIDPARPLWRIHLVSGARGDRRQAAPCAGGRVRAGGAAPLPRR